MDLNKAIYASGLPVFDCNDIAENPAQADLPTGCRIIVLPTANDSRGELCFMEGETHIPFKIARVFYIYNVNEGASRGDHSHSTCAEVVFAVHGAFTMIVDDGTCRVAIRMNRPNMGILIPAGVWCKLTDFAPGTVCSVLASEKYDSKGYTYSYEEYIESKR